ncbi:MAG: hypothetical protein ACRBF0_16560 [Calditrichia bacterium]
MVRWRVFNLVLNMVILLSFSSCNLFDFSKDSVDARMIFGKLAIENNISEPVYYFAVGEQTLRLVYVAPRISDENKVRPGSKKLLSLEELHVGKDENKILVFWWRAIEEAGELVAGDVQKLSVNIN